jgi:hypothetical protein
LPDWEKRSASLLKAFCVCDEVEDEDDNDRRGEENGAIVYRPQRKFSHELGLKNQGGKTVLQAVSLELRMAVK